MNVITDALVSAGIAGEAAARIAEAIRIHVSDSVRMTASTAATTSGAAAATVSAVTQAAASETEVVDVQSALYSKGFAQFSGDNVFDGSVSLNGTVNWNGPRRPTNMVLSQIVIQGADPDDPENPEPTSGGIYLKQKQVAVLNDYGDTKPLRFVVLAKMTRVALEPRVVVTGVSFDSANCQVVSATTSLWAISALGTQAPQVILFNGTTETNEFIRLVVQNAGT